MTDFDGGPNRPSFLPYHAPGASGSVRSGAPANRAAPVPPPMPMRRAAMTPARVPARGKDMELLRLPVRVRALSVRAGEPLRPARELPPRHRGERTGG